MNGGGNGDYSDMGSSASGNPPENPPPRNPNPPPRGNGGGAIPPSDPCDIREQGVLRSPNSVTIANVSVGDPVTIRAVIIQGAEVLVVDAKGVRLGVLDTPSEAEILECMKLGNSYAGAIVQKQGGAVSVSVNRAACP